MAIARVKFSRHTTMPQPFHSSWTSSSPEAFQAKIDYLYANLEAEISDTLEFKDGRVFERYSRPQHVDGIAVGRVWNFRDVC